MPLTFVSTEDEERFREYWERWRRDYAPQTEQEEELVRVLAETQWQLNHIFPEESAIYAAGRLRNAAHFEEAADEERSALVEGFTHIQHGKQLQALWKKEEQLNKLFDKTRKQLLALQAQR